MNKVATTLPEELSGGSEVPDREAVQAQLRAVLASPSFHEFRRCQQFLEYVCGRALAGDLGALKERSLAVEVFGRHPDSGLGEDTIVRVGAREVRKRLTKYYASADGISAPVVIELPLGSYLPEFRFAVSRKDSSPLVTVVVEPLPVATPVPAKPGSRRWYLAAACLLILTAGALAAWRWGVGVPKNPAFEAFLAPVLNSPAPLLIGVGHPIVYLPSHRAALLNEKRLPATPYPMQRPLALGWKELDGSDIVAVENQFIGFGDMVAGNEISQMRARRGHSVRVLLASSIPFADLRHSPTCLIGSLSNRWTNELSQSWRFRFILTPEHVPVIEDTQDPGHRTWTVPSKDDGSPPEDYCLIARIPNSPTGGLLIVSAGIKQFGTEAAGRLLAEPTEFSAILSKLPPWLGEEEHATGTARQSHRPPPPSRNSAPPTSGKVRDLGPGGQLEHFHNYCSPGCGQPGNQSIFTTTVVPDVGQVGNLRRVGNPPLAPAGPANGALYTNCDNTLACRRQAPKSTACAGTPQSSAPRVGNTASDLAATEAEVTGGSKQMAVIRPHPRETRVPARNPLTASVPTLRCTAFSPRKTPAFCMKLWFSPSLGLSPAEVFREAKRSN